jgi:ribosome-binding factor A
MPSNKSNRMYKVDEELKKEISNIISLELKNPHLTGLISVTGVKTTPDLRFAKVFVSMINEKNKKENLKILKQSSGYIRSEVARRVNLRTTPELIFEFDESLEYGSRIDEILKDITKDFKKNEEGDK